MSGEQPDITYNPNATVDEIFRRASVVTADGQPFIQVVPGKWAIQGLGFVPMKPFTNAEIRHRFETAGALAFIPDVTGNEIVIVKGYEHLRPRPCPYPGPHDFDCACDGTGIEGQK